MSDYIHLHNHTHYSLLDAACTPDQLIAAAKEDGQNAIALTDHGVMFGCYEFYKKAKKAGIKPILGCEVYIANGSRFDRSARKAGNKHRNYYHLVLLAKNDVGYKNLMKLCTLGHTEGFYYKPRIDRELLVQYREGLIALSACMSGVINAPLIEGNYEEAKRNAIWYKETFGEDFYIELQNHGLPGDDIVMAQAPRIASEVGISLICSNDCHYIRKDQAVAHNVLLNIRDVSAANSGQVDIYNLRYGKPEMYFKTQQEMKDLFKEFPQAIENTMEVAEKCDVDLKTDLKMPIFPIPPESKAKDLDEYLKDLTYQGLEKRYKTMTQEILERVEFELDVIKKMGFPGYFLIVQDFIAAARKKGVSVGPGRGSAAGSVVAYALGIINVDPLKYDLLFERFLNPDRISMPDIDIDFNDEKRDVVIEYVKEKYGAESVAQIITFGTLSTRAVLKDVGRVLGIDHRVINDITSKIPVIQGKVTPLKEALELPELRWVQDSNDPKIRETINYALTLEGLARNTSLHAAGIIIAPGDVSNYVPLYRSADGHNATQFTMKDIEDAGLLKMDFLGLRTLSILDNIIEQVQTNHSITIDVDALDLEDIKTYELLGKGKTLAVFQFESDKMAEYLSKLKPTTLEDLIAMNALYRPGPMDNIPDFIDRKQGRKAITYLHPIMEKSLSKTYGIIVYQEQVMQLARDLAGFTLAQADTMRRAMGKKDANTMLKLKEDFIQGAMHNSISEDLASEIFDLVLKFAQYGFNKSHSTAYAYLAYQTAWFKAHYTAEFLAANMTAELNDMAKLVRLINEAEDFGITVEPPDVNCSYPQFKAINSKTISFGLAGIKGVGTAAVDAMVAARMNDNPHNLPHGKPFTSIFDFAKRVDYKHINRRVLEALIHAGAFDPLKNGHRAQLFIAIDDVLDYAKALASSGNNTMESLFGGDDAVSIVEPRLPNISPYSESERLKKEKDVLNLFLSGHPLNKWSAHIAAFSHITLNERDHPIIGKGGQVCGMIKSVRTRLDKRENTIAFLEFEDFTAQGEIVIWSDTYKLYSHLLIEDSVVLVRGKIEIQNDQMKITADEIIPMSETIPKYAKGYTIQIELTETTEDAMKSLASLAKNNTKQSSLSFLFKENGTITSRFTSAASNLELSQAMYEKIVTIFGKKNVTFEVF